MRPFNTLVSQQSARLTIYAERGYVYIVMDYSQEKLERNGKLLAGRRVKVPERRAEHSSNNNKVHVLDSVERLSS